MTREELIQMLQILIDQAAPGTKEKTTVIYDVKADSFEWVIKSAIDLLEKTTVIYDVKADSFEWVIKSAIDLLERDEDNV